MTNAKLQFEIHPSSGVPIYRQIMDQVRALAASRRLEDGDLLPSIRQLAADLEVNMMTVSKAYARLEVEGLLERVRGTGMRVRANKHSPTSAERQRELGPLVEALATRANQLGLSEHQVISLLRQELEGAPRVDEIVIELAGLRKSFGKNEVLKGVDLRVPAGAIVGLMGMNGSGKSTLIKCLLGLLNADSGTAKLFSSDAANLPPTVKERLGYVPQVVYLYPWMKARHVIAYTSTFYSTWDDTLAGELAERWRLPLRERVQNLSTGQLQTLAIVLALAFRPDLLVLDEPVASLDPVARRDFLKSLLESAESAIAPQRTVLFSTHIASDLERVATHVAVLRDGRVSHFSELDELKDRVKRLRLRTACPIPPGFDVPGSLRTQVEGNSALAAVADVTPELLESLSDRWDAEVRVEDLNLEEIFVELNGHA